MSNKIDKRKLVELLQNLVKIDSINPSLVQGAAGETEIAEFIYGWMEEIGLEARIDFVEPERPNVVGILKGNGGGKSLMLNGHIDTVGVDYMTIDPFDPVIKNGRLYGRGSYDMKGGLAASMAAIKAIVDSGTELKGDIILAGVCDEEYASIGTEHLIRDSIVDAAVIGEPTGLDIQIAHKGFAWAEIITKGFAAHGSAYMEGIDAIVKMGHVLIGLEALQRVLQNQKHQLVGPGSIHASIINGGRELSTYPDTCKLELERRLIPGETKEDVEEELENLLKSMRKADNKFQGDFNITFFRAPMELDPDEEICKVLREEATKVFDKRPNFIGGSGWMDTQIIQEKGIPSLAFGPTGDGAHSAIEWVDLESVFKASLAQIGLIKRFCG